MTLGCLKKKFIQFPELSKKKNFEKKIPSKKKIPLKYFFYFRNTKKIMIFQINDRQWVKIVQF